MEKVGVTVRDSSSEFFYPKLLEKLKSYPLQVSKADLFYLYYGELFQTSRESFGYISRPEGIAFANAVGRNDCRKTISTGMKLLNYMPVDPTVLLHVNTCMKAGQEADTTYYLANRFNLLLEAILSTGNGLSKETAIKIVHIEDDKVLKGILRFLGGTESLEFGNNTGYSVWRKDNRVLYFEDVWAKSF